MFRTIALGVAFISCLLQAAQPEYEGYKSLKGLEKVGLEVTIMDLGAEYGAIRQDLEKQAASFLQEHNITPVSIEEARQLPGQPILRLSFTVIADMKINVAALQCSIALTQKTMMVRDQSIEAVEAKTWDNSGVTLIQSQHIIAASQDKLDVFLNQFIEDFNKANGKPSPSKKSNEKSV